jgi:hypothetical protein
MMDGDCEGTACVDALRVLVRVYGTASLRHHVHGPVVRHRRLCVRTRGALSWDTQSGCRDVMGAPTAAECGGRGR